jgi:hypothetical protein
MNAAPPVQFNITAQQISSSSLSFFDRFHLAHDSGAYSFVEAIFRAIGSFSQEEQNRIFSTLSNMSPAEVKKKFSRMFKDFQTNVAQAENIWKARLAGAILYDKVRGEIGVNLSQRSMDGVAAEVGQTIGPMLEEREREIHGEREAKLLTAYASLEEGNYGGAIKLYQELMWGFFCEPNLPSPDASPSATLIPTAPSLETPTDSNFIFFDKTSGEFKYENGGHTNLVAMANNLKARIDVAWNTNPLILEYQKKVAAATAAAREGRKDDFVKACKDLVSFFKREYTGLTLLSDQFDRTGHYLKYIDPLTTEKLNQLCKAADWGDSAQDVVKQSDAEAAEAQRKATAAVSVVASTTVPVAARPQRTLTKGRALAEKFGYIAKRYGTLKWENPRSFATNCVTSFKEMLNIIYPNARFRSDSGKTSLMDNVELGELEDSAFMKWDMEDQKFVPVYSEYEEYAAIANCLLEQTRNAWEKHDMNVLDIKDMIPDAKKALAEGNTTHRLVICREIGKSIEKIKCSWYYASYCLAGCSISALTEELNSSFSDGSRSLQEYLDKNKTTVISDDVAAQALKAISDGKAQVEADVDVEAAELKEVALSAMKKLKKTYDKLESKGGGTGASAYVELYVRMRRFFFSNGTVAVDSRGRKFIQRAIDNKNSLDTPTLPGIFFYDNVRREFVGHGSLWNDYVTMANALKKKTDEAHANEPALQYADELHHNNVLENAFNKVLELRRAALDSNDEEKAKKYEDIFRAMCLNIRAKVDLMPREKIGYLDTGYGPVHAAALFPELGKAFNEATQTGSKFQGVAGFNELLSTRDTAFKAGEILDAAAKDSELSEVMGKFAEVGKKFPKPAK